MERVKFLAQSQRNKIRTFRWEEGQESMYFEEAWAWRRVKSLRNKWRQDLVLDKVLEES